MKFITFQGMDVRDVLRGGEEYSVKEYSKDVNQCGITNKELERKCGYKPIFVTPIISKKDLALRNILSAPSNPECLIIFEAESSDSVDFLEWLESLHSILMGEDPKKFIVNPSVSVFKEYFVQSINPSQVIQIIDIGEDNPLDRFIIQDARLDYLWSKEFDDLASSLTGEDDIHLKNIFNDLPYNDRILLQASMGALYTECKFDESTIEDLKKIILVTD